MCLAIQPFIPARFIQGEKMNKTGSNWLPIAFLVSLFAVGIPFWRIPYHKANLPDGLIGPGLFVLAIAALLLRAFEVTPFRRTTGVMAASVPVAVLMRVVVEVIRDPTSHNLWPLEIVIAFFVGFAWALGGAVAGNLLAGLRVRR